jgi:serpin B
MGQVEDLAYAVGDGYQAVELPYDGKELSMVIVVPDAGRFAEVEGKLGPELMGKAIAALTPRMLSLTLPKWKVESSFSLKKELEALGMTDAFSLALANFSGIHGGIEPLYISSVIHKAYVSVNEQGTEATAATAVVMSGGAMPDQLTVDRPFIFVIRDIATDSILFVGRVTNPLG